jgi:hypothetical protein
MAVISSVPAQAKVQPVDTFFSAAEARSDHWRELSTAAAAWAAAKHDGVAFHQKVLRHFRELAPIEDYWSYPGPDLMRSLKDALEVQACSHASSRRSDASAAR